MIDLGITLCLVVSVILSSVGALVGIQGNPSMTQTLLIISCVFLTMGVLMQIFEIRSKQNRKEDNDDIITLLKANGIEYRKTCCVRREDLNFAFLVYFYKGNEIQCHRHYIDTEQWKDFDESQVKIVSNTDKEVKFEYDKTLYLIDKASGNCHVIVSTKESEIK